MEIQNSEQSSKLKNHHKTDLNVAIYYLPHNYDIELLCKLLKHVYEEEGKAIARSWIMESKNKLPNNFDSFWEEQKLTSYQRYTFDSYIKERLYDVAINTGWLPKALRKGKQSKKPPKMKLIKQEEEKIKSKKKLKESLVQAKERYLDDADKSFAPRGIINFDGACYFRPYMKKDEIPESNEDYKLKLKKIIDCEVWVEEAIEYIFERSGRQANEIQVCYRLLLDDKKGKKVIAEVTHEDITTKTRFSSFLVSKGFIKFIGNRNQFDMFHKFLINEQQYPTIRSASAWGEIRDGVFLFENGLYDTKEKKFYPADDEFRIKYKDKYLICPSGSEQVTPPKLSLPQNDTVPFLEEKFELWEQFNGSLNVRTTIGYAVAVVFSRILDKKYDGFPIFFKFGERGTGKSTSMDWFMSIFGYQNGNRQSVSKQNTIKSINRRMTLPASFPFFLDDYRNHETNNNTPDMTSPVLNWFHRIGTGRAKKSNDNQTIDVPMRATVVMTGNDKPTDPAVLDRMIILNYTSYLKKEEQQRIHEIADHTARLSEFLGLILEKYTMLLEVMLKGIEENKKWLAEQGFDGRTSLIWSYVLGGYQCLPYILPGLTSWHTSFEGFRNEICQAIKKEKALQNEQTPLFTFFDALEFFSTIKHDSATNNTNLLDHRHFRIREDEQVQDENGQIIYTGPVLAISLSRIWNSLQETNASITKEYTRSNIDSLLMNSKYFLAKSQQTMLSKGPKSSQESNVRCYYLNVQELKKRGMLNDMIDKAREYEEKRSSRLSK